MTLKRSVAVMATATIVSRILGFVRIVVVASLLGTTALGNTFQSTNSISNVLFDLLAAGALSAAIVPQLVHAMARNEEGFKQLISSLVSVVIVILGTISLIGILFATQISEVMFSRAPLETKADQIQTGAILLRFFMPQVLLYGLGALAVAALIAKKKFLPQVLAPIGSSLFLMGAIYIFRLYNDGTGLILETRDTFILGLAGTGACLAFVAIPIWVALRNGIRFLPSSNFREGVSALYSSVWAIAIQGSAAILLAMSILVGNQVEGAVVAYQLAFVFFLAPYAIISQSFSTVLLPDLSLSALEEGKVEFKRIVSKMMVWTYQPMLVATAVCIALYDPLTEIVARGRAASGQGLIELTFVTLVIGIVPYSVFQALSRVYFAKSNTRFPAVSVLISSMVFAVSGLIASLYFDGLAIAAIMGLAHTLTYLVAAIVLSVGLRREGYDVLPNKVSYLLFIACTAYAVLGISLEKIIDVETRLEAVLFCSGLLGGTILLIAIFSPAKLRRQTLNSVKEIFARKKVASG